MLHLPKSPKYALGISLTLIVIFLLALPLTFILKNIVKDLAYFRNMRRKEELFKENLKLKEEIFRLRKVLSSQKDLIEENKRLREMLRLKEKHRDILLPALVVARSPFAWQRVFSLDKGRNSGVEERDLVIDFEANLIGRIEKVEEDISWMRALSDPNFKIVVNCKGLNALLRGSLYEGARLQYIPYDFDIKVGDIITIPKSFGVNLTIKVGKVSLVKKDPSSLTQDVFVRPYSDLTTLREVFILKQK